MIIRVTFDKKWIYSGTGSNSFAVQRLITKCRADFGRDNVQVKDSGMDFVVLDIRSTEGKDEVKSRLTELINNDLLAKEEDKNIYTLLAEGEEPSAEEETAPQAPEKKASAPAGTPSSIEASIRRALGQKEEKGSEASGKGGEKSPLEEIEARVGSEPFKKLAREIHERAAAIRENHTEEVFFQESYLFSVNQGEGYTLALKQLAGLVMQEGIGKVSGIEEFVLPDAMDKEVAGAMQKVRGLAGNAIEAGRMLSFDLSGWIGHTSRNDFKSFLLGLARKNRSCMIVFRMPVLADKAMNRTREDLNDILSTRHVEFPPFNSDERHQLANGMLNGYGFTVEASAWEVFDRKIDMERADGFFYGVHTIRKTVNEMIHAMEMRKTEDGKADKLITGEKIASVCPRRDAAEVLDSDKMLAEMIGMEGVKQDINFIINQIMAARASKGKITSSMHMVFAGNPGTGKTTVARIIGQMLKERGVLRIGNFYEYEGRDLCGQYIGETAVKTSNICREAYGSLLFIDEAYSLYRGGDNTRDYGREAIDTLIAEMENHSDDLVVILAGYPDDMATMLTANAGMKSRIPYTLRFPNYNGEELHKIFMLMMGREFKFDEALDEHARSFFTSLPEEETNSKEFGNARFVRNIYERTWGKASLRCPGVPLQDLVLTVEDFDDAVAELSRVLPGRETRAIGFGN